MVPSVTRLTLHRVFRTGYQHIQNGIPDEYGVSHMGFGGVGSRYTYPMSRTQTTIRLRDELVETLDEEADERGVSRSEYVREILQNRHRADELQAEVETLRDRLDERAERVRALEQQLARRSNIEEKIEELPEKVREDPTPPWPVRWYKWFRRRREE